MVRWLNYTRSSDNITIARHEIAGYSAFMFFGISLITLTANFSVFLLLWQQNNKRIMNTLLLNLSFADFFAGIGIAPYALSHYFKQLFTGNKMFACTMMEGTMYFFCSGVSLLTLCTISYVRYLAIKYPTHEVNIKRRTIRIICAVMWLISAVVLVPNTVSFKGEGYTCERNWHRINGRVYSIIVALLTFCFPTFFLLLALAIIMAKSRNSVFSELCNQSSEIRRRNFRYAIKRLFYMIFTFLLCWIPFLVYWILANVLDCVQDKEVKTLLGRVTMLMSSVNPAVDPFLYNIGDSSLFQKMKILLYKHCRGNNRRFSVDGIQDRSV